MQRFSIIKMFFFRLFVIIIILLCMDSRAAEKTGSGK